MKAIGVGIGRTGTLTLKVALEKIGFAPCYHFLDIIKNPKNLKIVVRFGSEKNIEWVNLFEKYEAGVDFPFPTHYKEVFDTFPEVKVILTVRDPDEWYDSAKQTIYYIQYALINWLPGGKKVGKTTIWHRLFEGQFNDRDFAIKVFSKHIEDVKQFVPKDQLLIFNVKEGWGPLCEFLSAPIPDEPFPHVNQRSSFWIFVIFALLCSMLMVASIVFILFKLL